MSLHAYLQQSVARAPDSVAVIEPDAGSISYRALGALSDRLRDRLFAMGVARGDRVGLFLHKSIDSVAAVFGVMKAGAAYVPVDASAPTARGAFILSDCDVKVAVVEAGVAPALETELRAAGSRAKLIVLPTVGAGEGLSAALDALDAEQPAPSKASIDSAPEDLAYILYTSGSTGRPKGVMLTHRNACAFVDWCSRTFEPLSGDRCSSHAPFHFDLSIHDLYVPMKHGASLVLIGEEIGKEPARLAQVIAETEITIWYSAPSILTMLTQFGNLPEHDYGKLRIVLFAGEVFPLRHLRALMSSWPGPRYFNLYGPTETNVCTYYPVPQTIPAERTEPLPIGPVCDHLFARVVDPDGSDVARGEEGELCIAGDNVMQGYWNLDERTAEAFLVDDGKRYYRTGDVVVEEPDGAFTFRGRRDRMVKKRGYRVELGEIEACLYKHPDISEAAVVAVSDEEGVKIHAHYAALEGKKLSVIKLKRFCSEHVPVYMVPDTFTKHDVLPKTSTDKLDYQTLKQMG